MRARQTTLQNKLILSYLAVAIITVLVVSAFIFFSSGRLLMNLVSDQQTAQLRVAAQLYYASHNYSLEGFAEYYKVFAGLTHPADQPLVPDLPIIQELRGVYGLVDTQNRAVLPTHGYQIGQTVPDSELKQTIPVTYDGQVIARILPDPSHQFMLSTEERSFMDRSTFAIGVASLAGVIAAVLMGSYLSGRLIEPILRLTRASQSMGQGNLQQQVPVVSHDELGQLTDTFNRMSAGLARADQQRKRMTADISHDLSTPIQIISGYVEMLESNDVTLTPQRIEIIKTELEHLRRLVNDLTTLTQIEGGGLEMQLQPVRPAALFERIHQTYQPIAARKQVELLLDVPESLACIQVDEIRMQQVLKNLVDNALRYTPRGGQITLSARFGGQVQLSVSDTGSGILAEDLPYVFDRFYRVDKARGTGSGKMGLGLAICKALVIAQGGTIVAHSAGKDQGTTFFINFPLA